MCAVRRGPGWLRLGEAGRAKQEEGFRAGSRGAICPWRVGPLPLLQVASWRSSDSIWLSALNSLTTF